MEYQVFIEEGKTSRVDSKTFIGYVKVIDAANEMIVTSRIREGAKVTIANMAFDYPSQQFIAEQFTFDVIDGKADNFEKVK